MEPIEPYGLFRYHDFAPPYAENGDIVREYSADEEFAMPYDGYYYANFWLDLKPME